MSDIKPLLEWRDELRQEHPSTEVSCTARTMLYALDMLDAMQQTLVEIVAWVNERPEEELNAIGFGEIWDRGGARLQAIDAAYPGDTL